MKFSPLLAALIEALQILPGVGPKSGQRMALSLLERNRSEGVALAQTLASATEKVGHCQQCRNYTEVELCEICASDRRDPALLCIVETPADVLALEQTGSYNGLYFVLMGHLSPLDGIGPEQLGMEMLLSRIDRGEIKEIILATNPTVEGEATAHYIADHLVNDQIKLTRIAKGVPVGGELEYTDDHTLIRALAGRRQFEM